MGNAVDAQNLGRLLEQYGAAGLGGVEIAPIYGAIGYENRDIEDAQFRDDSVDAGEIGAGHQVTALYEIALTAAGKRTPAPLGAVRIRHKAPDGTTATEATFPMTDAPAPTFDAASADLRFAFAVAAFADVLRSAVEPKGWSLDRIEQIARDAQGTDPERAELIALIQKARVLRGRSAAVAR